MKPKLLFCWGANSHGQHGAGDTADHVLLPRRVKLPDDFLPKMLAGGGSHTLLYGKTHDGKPILLSCGNNDHGQLGHSPDEKEVLEWRQVEGLPERDDVIKISAGWDFSACICNSGALYCWGSNEYGQLSYPESIKFSVKPLVFDSAYDDVCCGMRHMVMFDVFSNCQTCGAGSHGQLGVGFPIKKCFQLARVVFEPYGVKPRGIVCGEKFSGVLSGETGLYTWGSNEHHVTCNLEKGSTICQPMMSMTGDYGKVASGWSHIVVLNRFNQVGSWGRRDYGQLGRGPEFLGTIPDFTAKDLACGSHHNLAIDFDDHVYAWGWNEHGMCGTGDTENVMSPRKVPLPEGMLARHIACGAGYSMVLCDVDPDMCLKTSVENAQKLREAVEAVGLFDKDRRVETEEDAAYIPVKSIPTDLDIAHEIVVKEVPKSKSGLAKTWREKLCDELERFDVTLEEMPTSYEKHGDLAIIKEDAFVDKKWDERFVDKSMLWQNVVEVLGCKRLCRQSKIKRDRYRSPRVEMLLGNDYQVEREENGIKYTYDVRHNMFSAGNITEKLRIAKMDCKKMVVVDLFAGIGYFTLPYLVHAGAAHVHACEINSDAVEALKKNLKLNKVDDRCTVHQGDCREVAPRYKAHHVNLGLIPTSAIGWEPACRALNRYEGGYLHLHQNLASDAPSTSGEDAPGEPGEPGGPHHPHPRDPRFHPRHHPRWDPEYDYDWDPREWDRGPFGYSQMTKEEFSEFIVKRLEHIFKRNKENWSVEVKHIEKVKSYAPKIDHYVFDIHCKPLDEHRFPGRRRGDFEFW